jgi:hypothetical protein
MATETNTDADEIRQIEHDLQNLERRYGALQDAVSWLKVGFGANVAALIGFAAWGVIIGNAGLVVIALVLLMVCGLGVLVGPVSLGAGLAWSGRRARWIDVVGWNPPGALGVSVGCSEAMAVEDMIADRRRRLAQLRARPH